MTTSITHRHSEIFPSHRLTSLGTPADQPADTSQTKGSSPAHQLTTSDGGAKAVNPKEAELVQAYLGAVQNKINNLTPGLIKVPPESQLGQWLGLYRSLLENTVVKAWMQEQKIDSATVRINASTGAMSAMVDGEEKRFGLTDASGWSQVSGPLLAAGRVIAPGEHNVIYPRFDPDNIRVSAKVVAGFYGETIPTNLTKARAQFRRLEHNQAFDAMAPDDKLRPASSRSSQALEKIKQDADVYYADAPQKLAYTKLVVDTAKAMPNTRAEAKQWADDMLFKLTGTHIDSDTVYFNRFKSGQSAATATGWEHFREEPSSSQRLPDALLKNFSEHDQIPGTLDFEAGLYTDGPGQSEKQGYGAHNQINLAPSKIMHESWKTDFQAQMTQKIDSFKEKHGADFRAIAKGEFTHQARQQLKTYEAMLPAERALLAPEHQFTRDDYRLVMNAVSNLPLDENTPLNVEQLKEQAPVNGKVRAHAFDINGFKSNDIVRFTAQDDGRDENYNGRRDGTQILYIPNNVPAFLKFASFEKLDQWVADQGKDPKKSEAMASHFALSDRQDHNSGSVLKSVLHTIIPVSLLFDHQSRPKEGVDTSLARLGTGLSDYREGIVIDRGNFAIKGDVFDTMTQATLHRMSSDADVAIKSNSEVTRDTWLNDVTAAAGLLAKFAPIAPPVAAVAAVAGFTELVLGTEKNYSGDTEAERKDGASKALDGALNTLFSATGVVAGGEDPLTLPAEPPKVTPEPPKPVEPLPEPAIEPRQLGPNTPASTSLIKVSEHQAPDGEQLISGVTPNSQGVYRITGSDGVFRHFIRYLDETGERNLYEIESRYKPGDSSSQIIDPTTKRAVMRVHPDGQGNWVRAPADGEGRLWRWNRTPSSTPGNESIDTLKISKRFLEPDGSKIPGAEKFDAYLNLNEGKDYRFTDDVYEQGTAIKRKLVVSWEVDDGNFAVTEGETARPSTFSDTEYSSSFAPDLNRERYSVVTHNNGKTLRTDLDYKSDSFEDTVKQRIEKFEQTVPEPALRARISEVAHQGSSFPALVELQPPALKENYTVAAGEKTFTVDYDPTGGIHTVTAKTQWNLKYMDEDSLITTRDMDITSTRTFTIRASNAQGSDGYTIDKSAPTKIEVSTPSAV